MVELLQLSVKHFENQLSSLNKGTATERMIERIEVAKILTRLQQCALGQLEIAPDSLKASQIVLAKVLPDLKQTEHTGSIEHVITREDLNARLIEHGIEPDSVFATPQLKLAKK